VEKYGKYNNCSIEETTTTKLLIYYYFKSYSQGMPLLGNPKQTLTQL